MIGMFRSIANSSRLEILRTLHTKDAVSYTDLKSASGFTAKKDSGKFAYHLRELTFLALIERNKYERMYSLTSQGRMILELVDRIANDSLGTGKLLVRTSNTSAEFQRPRIVQSLVKESNMPFELAEKMAKEVESKVYKSDITYITGSLIRDLTSTVLLETKHEEYRNKFMRVGMPVYDVRQMLSNLDAIDGGMHDLITKAGQNVFNENAMFDTLQKDIVDKHMSGDIHISNMGTWSTLPDVIFVNIKELLETGMDIGGKYAFASRVMKICQLSDVMTSLSIMIQLLTREASEEVVISGLPQLLAKKCSENSDAEIEEGLLGALMTSSPVSQGGRVSIRLDLSFDTGTVKYVLNAYKKYVKNTLVPRVGLIIDYDKVEFNSISAVSADIISLGGKILFTKLPQVSSRGVIGGNTNKIDPSISMELLSVSVNLPGLARDMNPSELDYFIARLVLILKSVGDAMAIRKKNIFEAIRRDLNPQIARNTQYMQRVHTSMSVNLVGLNEAVFENLKFGYNLRGRRAVKRILNKVVHAGIKFSTSTGDKVTICMVESEGAERFAQIDRQKYGKRDQDTEDVVPYSQGLVFKASELEKYTNKSAPITLCNKIRRDLNAGLQVKLLIARGMNDPATIKGVIEKMASLVPSFSPIKEIAICIKCGFKSKSLGQKCPKCQMPCRVV